MYRYDIINYLIKKRNYKSFLEIGVFRGQTTKEVKCCYKVGVDPDPQCSVSYKITSDQYFDTYNQKFDIIFIDGLHLYQQVVKDIDNSLLHLNVGGIISCHDCLPIQQINQLRQPHGQWTGDVWKAMLNTYQTNNSVNIDVVNTDWGVGLIQTSTIQYRNQIKYQGSLDSLNFQFYINNRDKFMNILTCEQFMDKYK